MLLEVIPEHNIDAFPMMEIVLYIMQNYLDSNIAVPPTAEDADLDRLLGHGIRIIYNNPQFMLDILKEFNLNKYNYTVKHSLEA